MRWSARLALGVLVAASPAQAAPGEQFGKASWYGDELRGRATASGEPFDPEGLTAAHPTLPLGSFVEVTALDSGRTILVRVNDRGPYHGGRIVDVSFAAARALGLTGSGARPVRIVPARASDLEAWKLRKRQVVARDVVPTERLAAWRIRAAWSAPERPVTLVPPGSGPLWLQIASFSSPVRARAMATRLGAQISTVGGIHRVRIGPFADATGARAALVPLAAKGYLDVRIVR